MKISLLVLLSICSIICKAQEKEKEPAVRVYFATPFAGFGISGKSSEMTGGALAAIMTLPFEFRNHWFLIPEFVGVAFRSPAFRQKTGLVFADYPRFNHEIYGLRVGKSFKIPDSPVLVRPSVGLDFQKVDEPYVGGSGWFGTNYDYKTTRTLAVPLQLDMLFLLHPPRRTALVFGMRLNATGRRPYGIVAVGLEINPFPRSKSIW